MRKPLLWCCLIFCVICCFAGSSMRANAQRPKKKPAPTAPVTMSVSDQIEHDIGEMLGAWQVGDVEAMHKYYAEDATWVAGTYDTPIVGWQNYLQKYLQQRQGFSGIQLITKNINVFHYEDTAWACYQWEFAGLAQGKTISARGQTTLVLVKKGDQWLIVHNHTSQICPAT